MASVSLWPGKNQPHLPRPFIIVGFLWFCGLLFVFAVGGLLHNWITPYKASARVPLGRNALPGREDNIFYIYASGNVITVGIGVWGANAAHCFRGKEQNKSLMEFTHVHLLVLQKGFNTDGQRLK